MAAFPDNDNDGGAGVAGSFAGEGQAVPAFPDNDNADGVRGLAHRAKQDSRALMTSSGEQRSRALAAIASALWDARAAIAAANREDVARAEADGLPGPIIKRLAFDEGKLSEVLKGVADIAAQPDPLGRVLLRRELDAGLVLTKVTCPIGVIGVIFESRPDALVQIAALCLKSGNCAILKGGSEAALTNSALYGAIHAAGVQAGLPSGFLTLLSTRGETREMLGCHEDIDLIVPRGSNAFVRYIMDNSDIPVLGHADGICHVYVDKAADAAKALAVVVDSKTQYVAACNAAETILVHRDAMPLLMPAILDALRAKGVEVREGGYGTEYSDLIVSMRTVDSIEDAIAHINAYGSHHTDAIVTEDDDAAALFFSAVDSAGVYRNCSTRFADGYRYGLGAELGISTGKIHARGPVGIEGLLTYKYGLSGDGHTVADYAEGRREFRFRDISG